MKTDDTKCTVMRKFDLDTPYGRLANAIHAAGHETVADFARVHNLNKHTVTSHANGNRDLSRKAAVKYAELLETAASWLLYAEQPSIADRETLTLDGELSGDGTVRQVTSLPVPLPNNLTSAAGLHAYVMGDNSMDAHIWPGTVMIAADPDKHDLPVTPGMFLFFKKDGRTYIRRYTVGQDGTAWLAPASREVDPRIPTFQLQLDPNADTSSGDTVGNLDIFAVLWLEYRDHTAKPSD